MLKDSNRYAAYRAGRLFSSICGILLLANCSLYNTVTRRAVQSVTPYRITVVQGNFVSSEAAAQLKAGMTREQARSVLGTPLLADMFHANRWDYLFYFRRGETQVVRQRHLTLYFDQDQLTHWSGAEDLPTEYELIAENEGGKTSIRSVTHRMRERLLSDAGSKNCNLRHFRPNGPDIGPGSSGRSQRTTGRRAGARWKRMDGERRRRAFWSNNRGRGLGGY